MFYACDNNSTDLTIKAFCAVENPTEELAWLKNEIAEREQNTTEDSKYQYVMQSTYNGETIIIYGNCCPLCNSVLPVYNCEGELIGVIGSRSQDFPFEVLTVGQIIWKTSDFACTF